MAEPTRQQAVVRPTAEVQVEVDDEEVDYSYGDEVSTASTSLRSSALKYEWKHGRRYHKYQAGSYNFPNDKQEQDRLDMVHHVYFRLLNDRLFLAPINPDGMKILDIGTGTGIWPIHLGDLHPSASLIVGNDLSAIQPPWAPNNVQFVVDDVELDWVGSEPLAPLIPADLDNLKPGGWVEFQESANTLFSEDDTLKHDNKMSQMMRGLMEACDRIGRTMDPAPSMKQWAEEAGFSNVKQQRFKLPVGSWPKDPRLKEIGTLLRVNFVEGVEAFTAAPFKDILGWSQEEVTVLNAGVRAAAQQKDVHAMFDFLVIMG